MTTSARWHVKNDRAVEYTNLSNGDGQNGSGPDLTLAPVTGHGQRSNVHCSGSPQGVSEGAFLFCFALGFGPLKAGCSSLYSRNVLGCVTRDSDCVGFAEGAEVLGTYDGSYGMVAMV